MPKDTLEEYKKEHNMKTSEEVFDFQKPAEHQCSHIDDLIKNVKEIDKLSYRFNADDEEEMINNLQEINHLVSDFHDELEKFRDAIDSVRIWGTEWKDLAKYMIKKFEIEVDTLI